MSREIIFPASKSLMLRDVWITDSPSDPDETLITVECIRCGKSPEVSFVPPPSYLGGFLLNSECECDSIFVSGAAYMSALPGVTIEDTLRYLNKPSFHLYDGDILPRTERSLKTWLSYQVGVPVDEIDIDFN